MRARLVALATETARELDVLGLDRDALGVDGSQVGVLKEPARGNAEGQSTVQEQGGPREETHETR